jgi:hypothetical protein
MQNDYPYVEINGQFFYLKQNPILLGWYLFYKTKSLNYRRAFSIKRKIRILKVFILIYCGLVKKSVVSFPFPGNLILRVHGGYRIFNFSRKIVTKVIEARPNFSANLDEVARVKITNQFDFTPKIVHWDDEQGWYEEELVIGTIAYLNFHGDSAAFLNKFEQDISTCLVKMILLQPPSTTTVGAIINQCNQIWENSRSILQELDLRKAELIEDFFIHIIAKLSKSSEQLIYKIITHGDFSLRNMLNTKDGLTVIDWEGIAQRSLLFDFYNFFLTELYYNRTSTNLIRETREAIVCLEEKLNPKNSEVAEHFIAFADVYRLIYYIERICMLLERGIDKKILEVTGRSIQIFWEYEKAIIKEK